MLAHKHTYTITIRFLNGKERAYTVALAPQKKYRHLLALHKMQGVRSVSCLREVAP